MPEAVEMPEPQGREELPYMIPLAVTMSILAVLVAIATLFGHRAATEELYLQTKATDEWSYYQAKNSRLHTSQALVVLLDTLMPADKEKTAKAREKYIQDAERYEKEKDAISEPAREIEKERELAGRKEDRFDASEVILEIGLIICSLTLLTRKKIFWYSGIGLGVVGLLVMLTGFLMR
jgi:ABC-type nickel/cobalt efflux system permease component RcnA